MLEKAIVIMKKYFPELNEEDFLTYLEDNLSSTEFAYDTRYLVFIDWKLCEYKDEALEGDEEYEVGVYSGGDDLKKIWYSFRDEMEIYEELEKYYRSNSLTAASSEDELGAIIQKMLDEGWEGTFFIEEHHIDAKHSHLGAIDLDDEKYYQFNGLGESFEYGVREDWKLDWRAWYEWKGEWKGF